MSTIEASNIIVFNKIIYFDEDSATDLIYMNNQGDLQEELVREDLSKIEGEATGSIGLPGVFKLFSGGKIDFGASGTVGTSRENLLNRVINNTVLTDYLKLKADKFNIKVFDNHTVYPYKNSLSYIKLIAPYTIMTEQKIDMGDFRLNIPMINKALEQGKGYYEMILEENGIKSVLRFNLSGFKNSYLLPDLVKMKLTYHTVEVGEINLEDLDMEKEFNFEGNTKFLDASSKALQDMGKLKEEVNLVKVYDVILAGVKND